MNGLTKLLIGGINMIWIVSPWLTSLLSVVIDIEAITLYPYVLSKHTPSARTIVHEEIHGRQQLELALVVWSLLAAWGLAIGSPVLLALAPLISLVPFYLLYGFFYLREYLKFIRLKHPNPTVAAYSWIPFEREAYTHEDAKPNYLAERKPFAWIKYI